MGIATLLIAGFLFFTAPVWLPRLRDHLALAVALFLGLTALALVTHILWW